jgi:hypothetical protein
MASNTEIFEYFWQEGNFGRYAPKGDVTLETAIEMISRVIEYARSNSIPGLLIDTRELRGFPRPSVVDRYWFVREWASQAAGKVVIAMVQRPDMIDSDQIGVTMASNAGLTANVFVDETAARNWLLANI